MKTYCLEVSAPYACFTRPEMKVERVSYETITPSAARAVFEAILWKPALRWRVRKIEVLRPIRWISLRRNEVGAVASAANVKSAMNAGRGNLGLYVEDERQQRAGLFLRDVAYRLYASFDVVDGTGHKPNHPALSKFRPADEDERRAADAANTPAKFMAMFERRAKKGQCINQPYLGCREFACDFRLVENPSAEPTPIDDNRELGLMLHDLDFSNPNDPQPRFFRAKLTSGVLEVPDLQPSEVRT